MHDPRFQAAVARIRGFDLSDDSQLLAYLTAQMEQGLSGSQWLLRAVLLYRAARYDEAVACADHAAEARHEVSISLYLKSCILRASDNLGEALEALEEARSAAIDDRLLPASDLAHARALLLWKAGHHDDALELIEQAIALDEHVATHWLHRGQLLIEIGRTDEAQASFERALAEEPNLHRAMYECAMLKAKQADTASAARWLEQAIQLHEAYRGRIAIESCFDELRDDAMFQTLVGVTDPEDLIWLDELAPWMPILRRELEQEAIDLEWLTEARSQRFDQTLQRQYGPGPVGTLHTDATLVHSRALLTHRRVVARGPSSRTREGAAESCWFFVDPTHPELGLWLALSESYPPFLWIRVGPSVGEIRKTLGAYFPRPERTRLELTRQVRGFIGYRSGFVVPSPPAGDAKPATIVELDRHFALNPFVESASWGSAYADDPWPADIPDQPELALKMAEHQQVVAEQMPGRMWSLVRRTRHSRSYLSIEIHHRELFIVQLCYRPSPHSHVVEAVNAHFGCDYPIDLPVDAVAALLGFQFDSADDLEAELAAATEADQIAGLLLVIAALRYGQMGVFELLRGYLGHPAPLVRSTVGDIGVAYNLEVLLEEMSLGEVDRPLRTEIEALLNEGIPAQAYNPYDESEAEAEACNDHEVMAWGGDDDVIEIGHADIEPERDGAHCR